MATSRKTQNAKTAKSQSRTRKKPGSGGQGDYYHIEVQPRGDFETYRTQDVGDPGHIQRVAGRRPSGSWTTVKWLIGKEDAHVEGGKLVPDTKDAKDLLKKLGSQPVHTSGDRFKAKDRPDVPERSKPTTAQTRARRENIKKAQAARLKK